MPRSGSAHGNPWAPRQRPGPIITPRHDNPWRWQPSVDHSPPATLTFPPEERPIQPAPLELPRRESIRSHPNGGPLRAPHRANDWPSLGPFPPHKELGGNRSRDPDLNLSTPQGDWRGVTPGARSPYPDVATDSLYPGAHSPLSWGAPEAPAFEPQPLPPPQLGSPPRFDDSMGWGSSAPEPWASDSSHFPPQQPTPEMSFPWQGGDQGVEWRDEASHPRMKESTPRIAPQWPPQSHAPNVTPPRFPPLEPPSDEP